MDEQRAMAEFLALVAIGSVGVSQDGRTLLASDRPGQAPIPLPAPDLDAVAREAGARSLTVEVARRLGLTGQGRAALRQLRAAIPGVVPDEPEYHRRVATHDMWVRAAAPEAFGVHRAPVTPPAPVPGPPPPVPPAAVPPPPQARGTGSLLFTPRSPGRSWTIALAGLSTPEQLREALSDAQCHELREVLARLSRLLDAPYDAAAVGPGRPLR